MLLVPPSLTQQGDSHCFRKHDASRTALGVTRVVVANGWDFPTVCSFCETSPPILYFVLCTLYKVQRVNFSQRHQPLLLCCCIDSLYAIVLLFVKTMYIKHWCHSVISAHSHTTATTLFASCVIPSVSGNVSFSWNKYFIPVVLLFKYPWWSTDKWRFITCTWLVETLWSCGARFIGSKQAKKSFCCAECGHSGEIVPDLDNLTPLLE